MKREIVIVGAGPAGLSLASFLLAKRPSLAGRVVVLEKARLPRDKICAGAIGDRAERLLRDVGIEVDVPSCPIRGLAVTTSEGTLVVRGRAVAGRVVRRRELDAGLAAAARSRGASIVEGAHVKGIARRADGVVVDLGDERIEARVVVGADGVGSIVRRALGVARGKLFAQVAEIDTVRSDVDLETDVLHFDLRDRGLRGYAWDFPTPLGGETRACRGVYELRDERDGVESEGDVAARLDRRTGSLERLGPMKRFAERGIEWHEPMAQPRVLLIGEAAGIDPVLGEGIAQAIHYGHRAAEYLVAKLDADDLGFDDWRAFVRRSRLGLDLSLRAAAIPLVYGAGRGVLERWVSSSHALASAGLAYFGGTRVDRVSLARAAVDFGRAVRG